jgi:predicted transcriptional regulator
MESAEIAGGRSVMAETSANKPPAREFLRMTAEVVAAYLRNNQLPSGQVGDIINTVYQSLLTLEGKPALELPDAPRPAVPIKKSITPEFLICLEDGKKMKMLKRHLRSSYNMTPEQYRHKWGLPPDYPMVAPNYAEQRSAFAKNIGLGQASGRTGKRAAADRS